MMFSLQQIDDRVELLNRAAEDLEAKAETQTHLMTSTMLRCHADGLRTAAGVFARMAADEIEREAREALR